MPLTRIQSLGITDGTIVNADINASAAIAGTKLSGVNDAKAWINFDGTGTPAIRASFNVSSITDNGTGDYTINFTNAISDANYSVVGSARERSDWGSGNAALVFTQPPSGTATPQTTSIRIWVQGGPGSIYDTNYINVAIFR
jgi:hypothetical protein